MKYLLLVTVLFAMVGCMSVKKAEKVMRAHPSELAKLCADCFPVRESELLKGDTIILVDTISEVVSDTIRVNADCPDGTKVTVDCPPNKIVTRVVKSHTTDTMKVRDTAYERVLSDEVKKQTERGDKYESLYNSWKKVALYSLLVIGISALCIALKSKLKKLLPWL